MICHGCNKDKSEHLFSPGMMKHRWPVCRECIRERNGSVGNKETSRRKFFGLMKAAIRLENRLDLRRQANREQQQKLIEARKKRLGQQ